MKFKIDQDSGVEHADGGPWRSYHIYSEGNTAKELWENTTIEEVDQDGEAWNSYGLNDAPNNQVIDAVLKLVEQTTGMKICDTCDTDIDPEKYEENNGECDTCLRRKK